MVRRAKSPHIVGTNLRDAAARARRERFVNVARQLFTRQGYANTTIDQIISRAAGSKSSITKFFGGKAGLLAAVIETDTKEYLANATSGAMHDDLEAALEELCVALLKLFLLPQALMTYRAAVGEGYHNKGLAKAFYHAGRGQSVGAAAERLRQWTERGLIDSRNPLADADRLTHMLRSGLHERILLGLQDAETTAASIRTTAAETARAFLYGVAVR